jgi:hypothetical protein
MVPFTIDLLASSYPCRGARPLCPDGGRRREPIRLSATRTPPTAAAPAIPATIQRRPEPLAPVAAGTVDIGARARETGTLGDEEEYTTFSTTCAEWNPVPDAAMV